MLQCINASILYSNGCKVRMSPFVCKWLAFVDLLVLELLAFGLISWHPSQQSNNNKKLS